MNQLILQLPNQFEKIIEQVRRQDWLICNFDAGEDDLYNPAGYVYNSDFNGIRYKIILDRNIFRFIFTSTNSRTPTEKQRAAIALICFCQAADINFEPNLAVYERLLPQKKYVSEAVDELFLFYRVDNASSDSLMSYSLSESDVIELYPESRGNAEDLQKRLTQYQWLTEWKSLYLILLKIIYFNSANIDSKLKLSKFMKWLVKDFRLSLVSIIFAVFLFSSVRPKNMVKFKKNSENETKLKQLYNMTWDLFFMNNFFRLLTDKDRGSEIIVATDDKIIKHVLRTAIDVQNEGSLQKLKFYLPAKEHEYLNIIEGTIEKTKDRIYDSTEWSMDYREELIAQTEKEVLSI